MYTSLSYFEFVSNSIALITLIRASPIAQLVKNLPAVQETPVWSLSREDPLEKGKAAHPAFWGFPVAQLVKNPSAM